MKTKIKVTWDDFGMFSRAAAMAGCVICLIQRSRIIGVVGAVLGITGGVGSIVWAVVDMYKCLVKGE